MPDDDARRRRQLAVALRYREEESSAPRVVARGAGHVARRILELAEERGVPIREDPDLADALGQLDLGDVIPADLYPAVAEVLAYIYRMNNRALQQK